MERTSKNLAAKKVEPPLRLDFFMVANCVLSN